MNDREFIQFFLRHQLLIFLIGISSGVLSVYYMISLSLFDTPWIDWESFSLALLGICFVVFIVSLLINIFLLIITLINRLKEINRIKALTICITYFICSIILYTYYTNSKIINAKYNYFHEATVVEKVENGKYIVVKPINEEYMVKLYCDITQYDLIEVGRNYWSVSYEIYDKTNMNEGILESMRIKPQE